MCVKESDNLAPATIYYADMWGSREERYNLLSETDVQSTEWCEPQPTLPHYLFVPQAADYSAEYEVGWEIADIFQTNSVGIATGRDKLTIHWTVEKLRETVADFVSLTEIEVKQKHNLKDGGDWNVPSAQIDLLNHPDSEHHIQSIHYRPFDTRWTYYTGQSSGFHARPRHNIMRHLLVENLALCVCRVVKSPVWQHILITDQITDKSYISNRTSESTYVFPLYLYPNPEELGISTERSLNFKPAFLAALSETLELPQNAPFNLPESISPEEILAYIYAILYSPTYRQRYYEFLKYDFPRIPLPQDINQFRTLATSEQRLIDWHLSKDVQIPTRHRFEGEGDGVVSKPRYADGKVWINPTQHFTDVSEAVWEYEIGAYQVCEKWLKDRKGEELGRAELQQYRAILVAVAETLAVMGEICSATVYLDQKLAKLRQVFFLKFERCQIP